jgi:hypothetical protein
MDVARQPASPLSSLFAGSEAAKVIDFLLSKEAAGIGARRVADPNNKDKSKDENTYYIRDDTDTAKSIRDLWYHLMQVQTKSY